MCQIDVCTCTRLFETMPGVQPPSPTPFSGQPPPPRRCPPRALPSIRAMPTLTATYTYSIRRPPTSPVSPSPSPVALHLTPVASSLLPSATHTTTVHLLSRTPSYSRPSSERLFLLLFPLPSSSNARSNPPGGYGTVSTGTPTRSLKENAIIRRTSTNELIVGASRYRQYWEVLYSTSPGATRL